MMKNKLILVRDMYVDGFRNMTIGKKLWALVIIKLIVIFFVFKLFFFPDILQKNYDNDEERARAVAEKLTSTDRQ